MSVTSHSIMERAVTKGLFFFGAHQSRAEIGIFGVFGILYQEIQDLTASAFMLKNP